MNELVTPLYKAVLVYMYNAYDIQGVLKNAKSRKLSKLLEFQFLAPK